MNQTQKEKEIIALTNLLNSNLEFIKWKELIKESEKLHHDNQLAIQIAEKCAFQYQLLFDTLDIADFQVKQLAEIYTHYNKTHELKDILEQYANSHPDYLNAQKYLFEFEIKYNKNLSLPIFQVKNNLKNS